jgi:MFS family permease
MYDLTFMEIGIVIAGNTVLVGLLQSPFGKLADRWPKVPMIIAGNLIGACALIAMPVAGGFWGLLAASVLIGTGSAMAIAAAVAIAVKVGKANKLMSSTMSLFGMSMSIGMMVSPLYTGAVLDTAGLEWIFPATGGLVLLGTCVVFALLGKYRDDSLPSAIASPEAVSEKNGDSPVALGETRA